MFQTQQQSRPNFFTLALIGVIAGLAIYGLWLFHVEPVYSLTTGCITPVTEGAKGLSDKFVPQIVEYVKQKPETLVTVGIGATSLIAIPLIKNYFENKKLQAEVQAQQAITDNVSLSQAYAKLEQEKAALQTQVEQSKQNSLQEPLLEAQNLLQQQKTEFNLERANLQGQIQSLKEKIDEFKLKEKTVVK